MLLAPDTRVSHTRSLSHVLIHQLDVRTVMYDPEETWALKKLTSELPVMPSSIHPIVLLSIYICVVPHDHTISGYWSLFISLNAMLYC